jgi:hypothetical protein
MADLRIVAAVAEDTLRNTIEKWILQHRHPPDLVVA